MQKFLILAITLFTSHLSASSPLDVVDVNAKAAILMNADTGTILYEKNAHEPYYPASTTKVATALFALKQQGHKLDRLLCADQDCVGWVSAEAKKRSNYTLPAYWLEPGGTHMCLKAGEEMPLEDLLHGLMLCSANDAANVIACHVGGTVPNFMAMLNAYLKEIGCQNTRFYNPHGLHHPDHKTTAYDLALITSEALRDATFREIVIKPSHTRPKTNMQEESTIVQFNKLVKKGKYHYPKAIGVKTGTHSIAGNCLVAAAEDDGRTLVAVLFKCDTYNQIFQDATALFKAAFKQKKRTHQVLPAGVLGSSPTTKGVTGYIQEPIQYSYYPGEEPNLRCLVKWETLELPVEKDALVGEVTLQTDRGRVIEKLPIYAQKAVKPGFFSRANGKRSSMAKVLGLGTLAVLFGFLAIQLRRR